MSYQQITSEERYTIARLRAQRYSPAQIAKVLGRARSTITRELHRNRCNDGHYRHFKASSRTRARRSRSRRNQRFTAEDFRLVELNLKMQWSPEQISGRLKKTGHLHISHETIYKYIWQNKKHGGTLFLHLRGAHKKRRKRYGSYDSRGRIADKRMIDERPASVATRTTIGHWEIDTVMGKLTKDCILTMVERKTGMTMIGKLPDRTTKSMNSALLPILGELHGKVDSLTSDNGTEFHGYREIEQKTGIPFYFCHPHHSWERGTNENTNGLIRQYLPKGKTMAKITQLDCSNIADKLNNRPRKRLGFKTPAECFYEN